MNRAAIVRTGWRWLEELGPRPLFLLLFVIGVTVRMGVSLFAGTYLDLERYEMERAALSVATHGTLADPYIIPTGPTAHLAPVYPLFLGLLFWLFGTGHGAELVKEVLSCAAASAQYALLPLIAPAFGITRTAGLAAGLFGVFVPLKFSTEVQGDWEAAYAGLGLLLLVYAVSVTWRHHAFTLRRGFLLGVAWGILTLTSSAALAVFLAVSVMGFFTAGRSRRGAYFRYAAVSGVAVTLCLAPWAWRNLRQLGTPVWTRSNLGLELRVSNNDLAAPMEVDNFSRGAYSAFHPAQSIAEAEAVRGMGEAAYNADRLRLALEWIRAHPRRFTALTAERFFFTWFPLTQAWPRDILLWLMTLAAIPGLIGLRTSDRLSAILLGTCLASFTLVFYVIQVSVRYRYPVDWILLILASSFAVRLVRGLEPATLVEHR